MNRKEIQEWIIKNCIKVDSYIDLSRLNFKNYNVDITELKAKEIYNNSQKAEKIDNSNQKAEYVSNNFQEAKDIYNTYQEAKKIDNFSQEAEKIINLKQKIIKKCETCDQALKEDKE